MHRQHSLNRSPWIGCMYLIVRVQKWIRCFQNSICTVNHITAAKSKITLYIHVSTRKTYLLSGKTNWNHLVNKDGIEVDVCSDVLALDSNNKIPERAALY